LFSSTETGAATTALLRCRLDDAIYNGEDHDLRSARCVAFLKRSSFIRIVADLCAIVFDLRFHGNYSDDVSIDSTEWNWRAFPSHIRIAHLRIVLTWEA
jgi:hypothetical protein